MEFSEFLESAEPIEEESAIIKDEAVDEAVELDVQKAVVESLAADKAIQDEQITNLTHEKEVLKKTIEELKKQLEEKNSALEKMEEVLSVNSETQLSNKVALLDRNMELPDRFEGETHDHILEVLREARDRSEADGRNRRAQILESVLVANEPTGALAERRKLVEKLFTDNGNILSGQVINELDKMGIPYKDGETYLLASEIIKKTF